MRALVLEKTNEITLRDIEIAETLGSRDVRIAVRNVGICGSDVHYYQHGRIGPFVVEAPLVLGHEAAGVISEVGSEVRDLKVGDPVCMEPGIPDPDSRASRLGMYNLDPGYFRDKNREIEDAAVSFDSFFERSEQKNF